MSATKRFGALLVALFTATLAVAGFGTSAEARPYGGQVTVSVSTTNPGVGADITISGQDFGVHVHVNITLHTATYNLGGAETDASGNFTTTVKLPDGVSGHHTILVDAPATHRQATIQLCIGTCQGAGNGGGSGNGNGGGLSATGVAVAGIGALGVVLLAGGGLLLLAGRRRNAAVR